MNRRLINFHRDLTIDMAKNYPDQLDEWIKHQPLSRRDLNRVLFLARRDEIKAALDAGYSAKTIWTHLHETGGLPFGYDTFLKYVTRLIRSVPTPPAVAEPLPASGTNAIPKPDTAREEHGQGKPRPAPNAGFIFNATPNKEELL